LWVRGTVEMHESAIAFRIGFERPSASILIHFGCDRYRYASGPLRRWQATERRAAVQVDRPMFQWRQVGAGTTRNEIVTAASFRT